MNQYREGKVGRPPNRGVKKNLKPFVYKRSERRELRRRAFCIMILRVAVVGEVKRHELRSRSESESEMGVESTEADAKPSDLPLSRLKFR